MQMAKLGEQAFDALSYCWGNPVKDTRIIVNGTQLMVTANLATALFHFRQSGVSSDVPIWIDAICINQADNTERGSQVQLMGSLYQQARKVHVWLSDESAVPRASMQALAELSEYMLQYDAEHWISKEDSNSQEIAFALCCVIHGSGMMVRLDGIPSHGTLPFFDVYRQLELTGCRSREIRSMRDSLRELLYQVATTGFVAKIRQFAHEPSYARLITGIFLSYRPLRATDPRDKVYGMLGLLPGSLDLSPDYTKPVSEVYTDLTVELIKATQDLEILHVACSGSADLPSWVPDLRIHRQFPEAFVDKVKGSRASAGLAADINVEDGNLLRTRGSIIDVVERVERGRPLFDEGAARFPGPYTERQLSGTFWNAITNSISLQGHRRFNESDAELCLRIMQNDNTVEDATAEKFVMLCTETLENYDVLLTAQGHVGQVPKGRVEADDKLLMLAGAGAPFTAMRQRIGDKEAFALRSPCVLLPFDPDPIDGKYKLEHEIATSDFLVRRAGLGSCSETLQELGKQAVLDLFEEVIIC
ncbi:uncharacterized protein RHO25_006931 [Cercospora beticola]|uniref:Heterokaryon incompatibility domain-containing protein n=1 Tax=Cercospora beticola TaxID=122368 RepID=A0ABZ0NS45_CERBT|nr:hypothetical protein RHO25_006931 [Cercospora beticola]